MRWRQSSSSLNLAVFIAAVSVLLFTSPSGSPSVAHAKRSAAAGGRGGGGGSARKNKAKKTSSSSDGGGGRKRPSSADDPSTSSSSSGADHRLDPRLDDLLSKAISRSDSDAGRAALRALRPSFLGDTTGSKDSDDFKEGDGNKRSGKKEKQKKRPNDTKRRNVRMPDHFKYLPSSDVLEELGNYALAASEAGDEERDPETGQQREGRWSERVVLEMFQWSVTEEDRKSEPIPDCFKTEEGCSEEVVEAHTGYKSWGGGWLDPKVHVCEWEGITCGITTAGAGQGKFPYAIDDRCMCDDKASERGRWKSPDGRRVPCRHGQYIGTIQLELDPAEQLEEDELYDMDEQRKRRKRRRVSCPPPVERPPSDAVTKIDLIERGLAGTLPPELSHLRYLHRLNLNDNRLRGTLPSEFGKMSNLHFIDVGENDLTGTIPPEWSRLNGTLDELWLEKNRLSGTLPPSFSKLTVEFLDVSQNRLTGTLPPTWGNMVRLANAYLEENSLKGPIPAAWAFLPALKTLDLGSNALTGKVPADLGYAKDLIELNLSRNQLTGTLPDDMFQLPRLESLVLSHNVLEGDIPSDMNYDDDSEDDRRRILEGDGRLGVSMDDDDDEYGPPEYIWTGVPRIEYLALDHNHLSGTVPPDMLLGISPTIKALDLSHNELSGTVPAQIGLLNRMQRLDLSYNDLEGKVPVELGALKEADVLNLTSNAFTGTIPDEVCRLKIFMNWYGCDSVLCPTGTFHPDGAANERGACVTCPDPDDPDVEEYIPLSTLLGRAHCESRGFVEGDMNGDGTLGEREVLKILHRALDGKNWGDSFADWTLQGMLGDKHCDLPGLNCKDGRITKLDLREAALCGSADGGENNGDGPDLGDPAVCPGVPPEIGLLQYLEVLDLSRSQFLKGTIPTEVGKLKHLRVLDFSLCGSMEGTIPTEIGLLESSLRTLNLAESSFTGTIPTELGKLKQLEKLNLGMNQFKGTLPWQLGNLASVKELLLSRSHLTGTLPKRLGILDNLENLELYGNELTGSIPEELGGLPSLKRIDCFNNRLSGTFPVSFVMARMLQIVHIKNNRLTGSIPPGIGKLSRLSWLDLSNNFITGQIPETLGSMSSLRDLRLGGNRIIGPIPESLCTNTLLNGGRVRQYGCGAILCPVGTRSNVGFANDDADGSGNSGCITCPEGETTQFLGSRKCRTFTQRDFLSLLFDAMGGETWPEEKRRGWKDDTLFECEWEGVSCDEEGKVDGLSFLLSGSSWDPQAY